jgi:hypothetical protein
MMAKSEQPGAGERRGPQGYENWRLASRGVPVQSGAEVPLYSDSHVAGEVLEGWGPYRVYNNIAAFGRGCLPVLILRADWHLERVTPVGAERSDVSGFHGGSLSDEIASLVGLRLGVRLRASSATRVFYPDLPPSGQPRAEDPTSVPTLPRTDGRRRTVVEMPHQVKLTPDTLAGYDRLRPSGAVALARAAMLFQNALWTCDSDPANAWLMLVSAAEVAAVEWRRGTADDDPEQLLRELKPKWVQRLEAAGDPALVRVKFVMGHLPGPPEKRPPGRQDRLGAEGDEEGAAGGLRVSLQRPARWNPLPSADVFAADRGRHRLGGARGAAHRGGGSLGGSLGRGRPAAPPARVRLSRARHAVEVVGFASLGLRASPKGRR